MANFGTTIFQRRIEQDRANRERQRLEMTEDRQYDLRVNQLALQEMNAAEETKQRNFWQKLQMAQLMGKASGMDPTYQPPDPKDDALNEQIELGQSLGGTDRRKVQTEQGLKADELKRRQEADALAHFDRTMGFGGQNARAVMDDATRRYIAEGNWANRAQVARASAGGKVPPNFRMASDLSRRFHQEQTYKDAQVVAASSQKIMAADDSGPGDLMMVTAFMKMIDPTTGVRDNERADALRAGGALENAQGYLQSLASPGARLTPAVRALFQQQTRDVMNAHHKRYDAVLRSYQQEMDRWGLDRQHLVDSLGVDENEDLDPSVDNTEDPLDRLGQ